MIVQTTEQERQRLLRNIDEANRLKRTERAKVAQRKMRQQREQALKKRHDEEAHWTDPMRQALDFAGLT